MLEGGWVYVTVVALGIVVPLVVIVAGLAWVRGMESVARRPKVQAVLFTVLAGIYVVLTADRANGTGVRTMDVGVYALCAVLWAVAAGLKWRRLGASRDREA